MAGWPACIFVVFSLAPLGSYELSAPDTWASIPVVEGDPGWAQDAATLLCDGDTAQATLAARLERTHPELITDPHLLLGVWVPDRSVPDIAGLMTVDWVLPDEGQLLDRSYYRGLIDPDRRSGHTVFNRQVEEVEVPAGPALLVREVIARRDSPCGSRGARRCRRTSSTPCSHPAAPTPWS